ncbi:unnamed protein product [Withania somnifera]
MAIEIKKSIVGLSKVANSDTHGEDSPYFAGWKAYDEDPFDEVHNPCGVIQMGLAENQVSFDLVEEYLEKHSEAINYGSGISSFKEDALFQDYHGLFSFRKAMANFMEKIRAANELLTFILVDPGDALLVPTPYYPGFDRDLRWRTGVKIIPVHCDSSNNFQVTTLALESAYEEAKSNKIKDILDFAVLKNIHLVYDEIYSGSTFVPRNSSAFFERVHIVYSLSKDLGLPGFRVGTIYSYNDNVVTTVEGCQEFTMNYIKTNRDRLKKRYEKIIDGLKSSGIECLKGNAGLFCWMNLSQLLEKSTRECELELWNSILCEVKLNISPGCSCHCSSSGWFRVCFANMSEQTLEVALSRLHNFMQRRTQKSK